MSKLSNEALEARSRAFSNLAKSFSLGLGLEAPAPQFAALADRQDLKGARQICDGDLSSEKLSRDAWDKSCVFNKGASRVP